MNNEEFVQELHTVKEQVAKIGTEVGKTLTKVTELEEALANAGNIPQPVLDAFNALKQQVQATDDLIPDEPEQPTE